MKKIGQKLSLFSLLFASSIPFSTYLTSCSCGTPKPDPTPSWVDKEIAEHDEQGWQHAIEYISSCKHPTIYMCSTGSLQIQQSINMYLASSMLAQELGHTYENEQYKYNDNIFMAPFNRAYHLKTDTPIGNFGYKYSTLINEQFGLRSIINHGVDKANNMVVTNLQDFNTSLADYDKTADDYAEYNSFAYAIEDNPNVGFTWIEKILDKIFSLYPEDTQFNIVWSETDFLNASVKAKLAQTQFLPLRNILTKILRKVDKIYTVSEGWSTVFRFDEYKQWYIKNGYTTYAQKKDIWDSIKKMSYEDAKTLVSITDIWFMFMNCEKFVTCFATGNDALTSSRFLDKDKQLIKETAIKPCYPWFSIYSYQNLYKNKQQSEYFKKFEKAFLTFYLFYEGNTQTFSDYIINTPDIPNYFDKNKKNLIFLLPSFMGQKTISECEDVLKEYKKTIDKIVTNYPADKWNYIYKFHPRAKNELVVESLKVIFNNQLPTNTVVLKHTLPSEYLFALDDYLVRSGIEQNYHLIDPNTLNQDKPNGIITGEDLVSTSVYTSMEMLANELNCNWDNVKKIIQTDAYYIPSTYKIGQTTIGEYAEYNKNWIISFFNMFYEVKQFIDPNNFQVI